MTNYNPLFMDIATVLYQSQCDRDFFLAPSGIEGRHSLGERGMAGYHLIDATGEQILEFVRRACAKSEPS